MSEIKDGGPAFPSPTANPMQNGQVSVRDYFAALAMQAILQGTYSQSYMPTSIEKAPPADWISRLSIYYADAMIAARVDKC